MLCETYRFLLLIYFIKTIMKVVFLIVPIIFIITAMIEFIKVIASNSSNSKEAWNKFLKKSVAVIFVFLIPSIINFLMSSVFNFNSFSECYNSADRVKLDRLKADEIAKKEIEAAEKEKEREENKKNYESAIEGNNKIHNNNTGGNGGSAGGFFGNNNISEGASGDVNNALGVVYYMQCDPRWKDIDYDIRGGENGSHATICSSACGYTSFAMIAAGLNNTTSINPYTVIKAMRNISDGELTYRGYGAASIGELSGYEYTSKFNLKAEVVGRGGIDNALANNKPVVALFPGHYMAISKSSNGKVVLLDPYTNWRDQRRKSGEYDSVAQIEALYGSIQWAAAYERIWG